MGSVHRCINVAPPLGKSSLTVQFVEGHFVDSYYPTIENNFAKVIKHRGQDFATEIVDTAGQVSQDQQRCPTLFPINHRHDSKVPSLFGFLKRPAAVLIDRFLTDRALR